MSPHTPLKRAEPGASEVLTRANAQEGTSEPGGIEQAGPTGVI